MSEGSKFQYRFESICAEIDVKFPKIYATAKTLSMDRCIVIFPLPKEIHEHVISVELGIKSSQFLGSLFILPTFSRKKSIISTDFEHKSLMERACGRIVRR